MTVDDVLACVHSLNVARVKDRLLDLVYPRRCPLCDRLSLESPCQACTSEFEPAVTPFRPEKGLIEYYAVLYGYSGRAAQAVKELKYSRRTSMAVTMAEILAHRYRDLMEPVDAIVPVPIHWSRRCQRGFNQSELLCERMPRDLVQPHLLTRIRATRPQVGLSHDERLQNLNGAFRAKDVSGMRLLLVDDVLTSGGTARECSRALRSAGADDIGFLAFAGEPY